MGDKGQAPDVPKPVTPAPDVSKPDVSAPDGPHPDTLCEALLCSYPSSGRTWVRFMLADVYARVLGEAGEVDLNTCFDLIPNLSRTGTNGFARFDRARVGELPVIAGTHAPFKGRWKGKKIVWLVRDPMDTLCSRLMAKKERLEVETLEQFLDASDALERFGAWADAWCAWRGRVEGCEVRYSEVIADPASALRRILTFLGVDAPDAAVARAVERGARDNMRRMQDEAGIGHRGGDSPNRVREGGVGRFRERISEAEQRMLARRIRGAVSAETWALLRSQGSAAAAFEG